jgi:hypothetical protein
VERPSTLLWYALPTRATADGKIEPGCNVRQAQAGAILPSADVQRGIGARRATLVGVTGAELRIPITSRPCGPAVLKSVVLWHSHDSWISPAVCRGWPSVPTAQGGLGKSRQTASVWRTDVRKPSTGLSGAMCAILKSDKMGVEQATSTPGGGCPPDGSGSATNRSFRHNKRSLRGADNCRFRRIPGLAGRFGSHRWNPLPTGMRDLPRSPRTSIAVKRCSAP